MSTRKLQIIGGVGTGESVSVDSTLTQSGQAADAKIVGDEISDLNALVGDTAVADQINTALTDSVITIDEIDAICGQTIYMADEVNL